MRKSSKAGRKSKDCDLNGTLEQIRTDIAVIRQELKMHRWLLGLIFGMISAILVKALFL